MAVKRLFAVHLVLWGILLLGTQGDAWAIRRQAVEEEPPQVIVEGMATKLFRGVVNAATGWLEFPKQIYVTWLEDGAFNGIFIGPPKGVGMAVVRTAAGGLEAATFYFPYPGFYDPYFEPTYIWERD
jgi:putative exosortase-associated protein (TIGR04073 family)